MAAFLKKTGRFLFKIGTLPKKNRNGLTLNRIVLVSNRSVSEKSGNGLVQNRNFFEKRRKWSRSK
jgi:hypothetical protein